MYTVKSRFYAEDDCFGEAYVIVSDNGEKDTNIEIGSRVKIIPICSKCGKDSAEGTHYCEKCYKKSLEGS